MNLDNPQALWLLLLAIPLAGLYLRRTAVPKATVTTGFLWRQVLAAHPRQRTYRRWRTVVSAGVQTSILILLVLAAARPPWPWPLGLSVAALVLLVLEWPFYRRRWLV